MSDESIVETEGVTVTKAFDAEGFPVPAVTFRVESDRSDPVGLRITDEIPEGFGIEQIGFHPDYGSEHWTATGEGIVRFERTVNPGEAFTTVYGIRMADDDEPAPFLESPSIEVDPDAIEEEDLDDVVPKESSEIVRELASGKRDTVPGLEEEEDEVPAEAAADSGVEAVSSEDAEIIGDPEAEAEAEEPADEPEPEAETEEPILDDAAVADDEESLAEAIEDALDEDEVEEPDEVAEEADVAIEADDEPEPEPEPEPADEELVEEPEEAEPAVDEPEPEPVQETMDVESIAAAFAAEIEAGNVDDDDLAVIREAVTAQSASNVVRIEHLQSRVSDLEAYSDALESFIDENGEAQELLDDLESELSAFESDLNQLDRRLESAASERQSLDDRLDNVAETLDEFENVDERLERLRGDLEALDERVDDTESDLMEMEDLEEDIESLREEVREVKQWRDQLSNVFGGGQ